MTAKTSNDMQKRSAASMTFYYLALALAGVDWQSAELFYEPLPCHDPDSDKADKRHHSHINGVSWRILGSDNSQVLRYGRISRRGRVTEAIAGEQRALPFGGNWNGDEESAYQQLRWKAWNAVG